MSRIISFKQAYVGVVYQVWVLNTMGSTTMNKINYFNTIPVVPKKKSVLSRLGHSSRSTSLSLKDQSFIDDTINLGMALCRNQGAAGRFAIKNHAVEAITLKDGTCLESRQLAGMLKKSDEVLLMAGTAGTEITDMISMEISLGNAAKAVVLDALASVSADMTLDWIMDAYNKTLSREGRRLTRKRFSPGFGDLPLKNQLIIFRLLVLERLNLSLNDSMMLVPEKSVLAVAGIERVETN